MVTEWDLDFGPSSVAKELRSAYRDRDFVLSLPPLEGAQSAVCALAASNILALVAVTSRPLEAKSATDDWLKRYFPGIPVRYASRKESLPIDALVDDFPLFVERFAAAGRKAVLFSRPWNVKDQGRLRAKAGVTVAANWSDVVRLITGMSQRSAQRAG